MTNHQKRKANNSLNPMPLKSFSSENPLSCLPQITIVYLNNIYDFVSEIYDAYRMHIEIGKGPTSRK